MFVIELLLDDGPGEGFLSDLHFYVGAQSSICTVDESHTHAFIYRDGLVSGGYLAYHLSIFPHRIAISRNRFIVKFDAYQFFWHALALLTGNGLFGLSSLQNILKPAITGEMSLLSS